MCITFRIFHPLKNHRKKNPILLNCESNKSSVVVFIFLCPWFWVTTEKWQGSILNGFMRSIDLKLDWCIWYNFFGKLHIILEWVQKGWFLLFLEVETRAFKLNWPYDICRTGLSKVVTGFRFFLCHISTFSWKSLLWGLSSPLTCPWSGG